MPTKINKYGLSRQNVIHNPCVMSAYFIFSFLEMIAVKWLTMLNSLWPRTIFFNSRIPAFQHMMISSQPYAGATHCFAFRNFWCLKLFRQISGAQKWSSSPSWELNIRMTLLFAAARENVDALLNYSISVSSPYSAMHRRKDEVGNRYSTLTTDCLTLIEHVKVGSIQTSHDKVKNIWNRTFRVVTPLSHWPQWACQYHINTRTYVLP